MPKFSFEERFNVPQILCDQAAVDRLLRLGLFGTASFAEIEPVVSKIWDGPVDRVDVLDIIVGRPVDVMEIADSESVMGQAYRSTCAHDAIVLIINAELGI